MRNATTTPDLTAIDPAQLDSVTGGAWSLIPPERDRPDSGGFTPFAVVTPPSPPPADFVTIPMPMMMSNESRR